MDALRWGPIHICIRRITRAHSAMCVVSMQEMYIVHMNMWNGLFVAEGQQRKTNAMLGSWGREVPTTVRKSRKCLLDPIRF